MLCMPLVLNVTAFIMAGCLYASLVSSLLCLYVLGGVCRDYVFVCEFFLWNRHDLH